MAICCANQPLEDLKLHKIIAIFQRLAGPHQKAIICAIPGPPSDSYFTDEGKPNVWHISSCGKRSKTVRSVFQRLSKRLTANARTLPALMISASGTFNPSSFASSKQ